MNVEFLEPPAQAMPALPDDQDKNLSNNKSNYDATIDRFCSFLQSSLKLHPDTACDEPPSNVIPYRLQIILKTIFLLRKPKAQRTPEDYDTIVEQLDEIYSYITDVWNDDIDYDIDSASLTSDDTEDTTTLTEEESAESNSLEDEKTPHLPPKKKPIPRTTRTTETNPAPTLPLHRPNPRPTKRPRKDAPLNRAGFW